MPRYRLAAAPTDDTIRLPFDDGTDLVDSGPGNDTVFVYEGNDTVAGGTGNDNILGAQGDDELHGDASVIPLPSGNFRLEQIAESASDRDFITGGDGNDFVYGESDDDVLFGGVSSGREDTGRDVLNGGTGNDVLFGGAEPGTGATDNILGGDSGLLNFPAIVHAPGVRDAGTAPGEFVAPQYLESDIVQILRPAGAQLKFEYEPPGTFSSLLPDLSTVAGGRVKVTTVMPDGSSSSDYLYGVEYAKIYDNGDVASLTTDAGAYWTAMTPAARAAVFSASDLVPLTQWTFDIGRYANGTGILRLLRNGIEVAREDSSALATLGNLAATGGACAFAWDDTTPISAGTGDGTLFDAIYRVNARAGKPQDGPGAFELQNTVSMTGAGAVARNNIQIHWSTNQDPPHAWTNASEGCYTLNTSVIQAMERLVLAYGGQNTDQFTFKTNPGISAAHDVIGGTDVGSAGVTGSGESWLNLFWRDDTSNPTNLVSQIQVQVRDLEPIQQPKVVTTKIAALLGDKYLVTLGLYDGADNKVSKLIRVFFKINGSGREYAQDILPRSGKAEFTVTAPTPPSGGTPYLQVTGVSPVNSYGTYRDFGPIGSDGRSRLMKLFFDTDSKKISLVPTVASAAPLEVTPTSTGLDATLTDPAALPSVASLDLSGSYDSLRVRLESVYQRASLRSRSIAEAA